MSVAKLKKRQVPKVNMSTTNDAADSPEVTSRTATYQEISEWQFDNKFILSGYRREKADYLEVLGSLGFLHNETCNVYTHLIGALLLPLVAAIFLRHLAEPQFSDVSAVDYSMFGIYFVCAETCLILSTLYHLMQPHSHRVEQFWHGMDLLGIVIVTIGTFSSGIYFVFFCDAHLRKLHWAIVSPRQQAGLISQDCADTNNIDPHHGHHHWYSHLAPVTQDATLAQHQGWRLCCLWRFVVHSITARGGAIWYPLHDAIRRNEMVSGRAGVLWNWSHSIRCMFAFRMSILL